MLIVTAIVSILLLASLAWLAGRKMRSRVCPVCVGVAGSWLWMIGARFLGFAIDPVLLAVLCGASALGVAGALERRLPAGRSPVLWKLLLLLPGLVAAYGVAAGEWVLAGSSLAMLALGAAVCLRAPLLAAGDETAVRKLEEQMKRCC